jgi:hypothetical protein
LNKESLPLLKVKLTEQKARRDHFVAKAAKMVKSARMVEN